MKFHLSINLERSSPAEDMNEVMDHTLEMVQMADRAGFETVWTGEHHALEMTIAPNPFQLLAYWADKTDQIRLGPAVVNAAYWHPIRLAGEAALLDLISGGRLEFGIGSGAYQREFDRMHPGLDQKDSWRHMQEMLPAVRALWQGDYAHDGAYWQFPASTSCPKPKQGEVPVWVAARSPITFDYAVQNGCSIMTWPITMPFAEAETYKERLDTAITAHGQPYRGTFAMMRHTSVYTSEADREALMAALIHSLARFGNLMMKAGEVTNGFVEEVPLEKLSGNSRYDPATLHDNLSFGSPDEVTEKIKRYEALGVDAYIYNGSMGLDPAQQRRAFGLFIDEVLPAFA